jgi:glyoxylase-like metal-dependent hydrolase (beta-lactamase superfamily II)
MESSMRLLLAVAFASVLAVLTIHALGQQPLKPEPMRIEKVKENLFVVRGPFNACAPNGCGPNGVDDGLLHEAGDVAVRVTSEGVILVDDKFAQNVPDVLDKVKSVTTQPIKYLLNSHHHTDHVGGDGEILSRGIEIIAHRNVRENIIRNRQPGPPRVVFSDQASVYLGGIEVQMRYLGRGHTNGDTVIYFPDLRTVHSGDLVIDGMPVIDYNNGGSALEFVTTLNNLMKIDFDTVIPGHGRILTKDFVRAYIPKLETMNKRMAELVKQRVPKDQLQARLKLDDIGWDHTVSTGTFMRSIAQYYEEVASVTK